jgi:glycine oxidase
MQIGIVGAGIMGRLLAFLLIEAGHVVSLFDQGNEHTRDTCSFTAAGLLTPLSELDKADKLIYQLGSEALQMHWPRIIHTINQNIYFQIQGSIILSHPKDTIALKHYISLIQHKMNDTFMYQQLDHQALLMLEPQLSKFDTAYFFLEEGQLDSQAVMSALQIYCEENHITWYKNTFVSAVLPHTICTSSKHYEFDIVIDCCGMGAKKSWIDLQGVRGELIWLQAPSVDIKRPIRFIHPRYSLYVVPRPNNIYLVGATEIYSEDISNVSVKSALELLTMAYYLHSGFSEANIINMAAQCRPTLLNHLPKIKYADGLIAVNGLYRHGFLISPTLAVDILRGIKQWQSNDLSDLSSFLHYPRLWERI